MPLSPLHRRLAPGVKCGKSVSRFSASSCFKSTASSSLLSQLVNSYFRFTGFASDFPPQEGGRFCDTKGCSSDDVHLADPSLLCASAGSFLVVGFVDGGPVVDSGGLLLPGSVPIAPTAGGGGGSLALAFVGSTAMGSVDLMAVVGSVRLWPAVGSVGAAPTVVGGGGLLKPKSEEPTVVVWGAGFSVLDSVRRVAVAGSVTLPSLAGSVTLPALAGSVTLPALAGSVALPPLAGSVTLPAVAGTSFVGLNFLEGVDGGVSVAVARRFSCD